MDLNELGRALGEDTMEKTANIFDGFFTKSQSRLIPSTDAADFQTVTDINNMKRNPNVIKDPGMVYHPDGTVSVKPNEVAHTYKPPVENAAANAGAEAGAGAAAKTEQKAGGFLSRLGGKGLAIGALGALALGGLGYGAYRAGQNSQQQTATGPGTYQAGPAY